jgi:phage tail sheath gpL-like
MSGSITFNEIPQSGWDLPRVAAEIRPSYTEAGIFEYPKKALIFGVKVAGAAGAASVPFRVTRLADATARAGAGSIAEDMAADMLADNPSLDLWMILVAEASGAAKAAGSFAYSGTPTAAGTIARYIAGRRVAINITTSDTATTIAAALRDAINAIPNMPVVATASTGTCTCTAKHAIDVGNDISLLANLGQDEATPPGITETITAMTGGSGAVDLTAALAAVTDEWFPYLVVPVTDTTNMGLLSTELDRRYNALGHLDAQAFIGMKASLSTLAAYAPARNQWLLNMLGAPAAAVEPRWRLAAMFARQAIYYLAEDPARQLHTLPLRGMRAPVGGNFIDSERNILVKAGVTTFRVANGVCILERAVSTCTLDAQGVPTKAKQDIMEAAVASRIRYDYRTYWQLNYPRHKLAPDGSPAADASDNVMTPEGSLGVWAARCVIYQRLGWIVDIEKTLPLCRAQLPADGTRNRVQQRLVYRRIDNMMQLDIALEYQA